MPKYQPDPTAPGGGDTLHAARPVPTDPNVWRARLAALHAAGVRLPDRDRPPAPPTVVPEPWTGEVRQNITRPEDAKYQRGRLSSHGQMARRRAAKAKAAEGGEAA